MPNYLTAAAMSGQNLNRYHDLTTTQQRGHQLWSHSSTGWSSGQQNSEATGVTTQSTAVASMPIDNNTLGEQPYTDMYGSYPQQ